MNTQSSSVSYHGPAPNARFDNTFTAIREAVTAEDAARFYGMEFSRDGKRARCCFHSPDKNPSMTFRGGNFRCWSCGAHGSSIDLTMQIFGISAVDAVKKLNSDFRLGFAVDHEPSKDERAVARRRQEIAEKHRQFEAWRESFIHQLDLCCRRGNLQETAEAIRFLETATYYSDTLAHGSPEDQAQIYRERGEHPEMDRQSFEGLMESGAFDEPDVFKSLGLYCVPDLTEEERRPPEFIIDGMIPVGMTFLSGAPKIRKSFLALQMAIATATGTPFWGHSVLQCDVVYLDLEGSKSRISSRSEHMSTKIPRNVFVTNAVEKHLADGLVDELRLLHQQRPTIRLIIIDTYSRARGVFHAGNANAYDADVRLLEPVQRMAISENIAVVFVHHDKKGAGLVSDSFERLSGTMGISGSADCVLNLIADGKRFDGKAKLEYTPRDAKGGELSLVFDDRFMEWTAEEKTDLRGNPVCGWIIQNVPERGREGRFFSYEEVFSSAYRCAAINPGERVLEQIKPFKDELYSDYGIGVQLGCRSNCKRGIRIINLQ